MDMPIEEPEAKKRKIDTEEHKENGIHDSTTEQNTSEKVKQQEKEYFGSYAHLSIHEEMLKDSNRTNTYRQAIFKNKKDFQDKVVLDLGCGTGILSFFCCQAGAKTVYAVDASDIVDHAKEVVDFNNYSDRIKIIKGKFEDLELPEKVDVIVSEWMGYALLYESMLDSVLLARDKYLKEGGLIFPAKANAFVTPFTDHQYYIEKVSFWGNVYGIDFSPIIPFAKKCACEEPLVDSLNPQCQLSFPKKILTIDLNTIKAEDLREIRSETQFISMSDGLFCGFCLWFDVLFEGSVVTEPEEIITLSTSPSSGYTHWKQTLLYLQNPIDVRSQDIIKANFTLKTDSNNKRCLNIWLDGECQGNVIQTMWPMK